MLRPSSSSASGPLGSASCVFSSVAAKAFSNETGGGCGVAKAPNAEPR